MRPAWSSPALVAARRYDEPGVRALHHALKAGSQHAVLTMAIDMQPFVAKDAVLVPMPSSAGRGGAGLWLATALHQLTGRPVVEALRGRPRMSVYAAKKQGISPTFDLGFKQQGRLPAGRITIIDNVVGTGHTARSALRAFPSGATVLVHAIDVPVFTRQRWWNLPGGNIDPGETPAQAAKREAVEEADIRISKLDALVSLKESWGTLHLFITDEWTGTPQINEESSEMRWVAVNAALGYDLVPGLRDALAALAEAGSGRQPPPVARNPLLAKPPRRFHQLQDTRRWRRLFGRPPQEADYDGVHTASEKIIAEAYAMGSWSQLQESYPVVVTLDVSGLTPVPDVDAMLRGAEAADELIREYRKRIESGETFDDLIEDDDYREAEASVGDVPAAFIFEDVGRHVVQSIRDYAEAEGEDEEEVFATFLRGGELPPGVLTRLVGQQRYMTDFDLDRIVRIEAIKPWWSAVLTSFDDDDVEQLEARGFTVFTLDDWPHFHSDTLVLYEAPDAKERSDVEYHGTTSVAIEQAFPGLIPEETPFPIREE